MKRPPKRVREGAVLTSAVVSAVMRACLARGHRVPVASGEASDVLHLLDVPVVDARSDHVGNTRAQLEHVARGAAATVHEVLDLTAHDDGCERCDDGVDGVGAHDTLHSPAYAG